MPLRAWIISSASPSQKYARLVVAQIRKRQDGDRPVRVGIDRSCAVALDRCNAHPPGCALD